MTTATKTTKRTIEPAELASVRDVAARYGVAPQTVVNWVKRNACPVFGSTSAGQLFYMPDVARWAASDARPAQRASRD